MALSAIRSLTPSRVRPNLTMTHHRYGCWVMIADVYIGRHGFGAALFSVGVSSQTLTELGQLVACLRASEGSYGVSTRPCSGRRTVAVLREASRPHHLSIHTG